PTTEVGKRRGWFMKGRAGGSPRRPVAAGEIEILLRVDLHVAAGGVGVAQDLAGLDHLLQEQDEVGLLEDRRLAPRPAGEAALHAVEMLPQPRGPGGREAGDAGELAVRLGGRDGAVDAGDAAAGGRHLLAVVGRM